MKIKNLLAGMVLLGTSTFTGNIWAADWGPCRTASGDPFIFVTSFTKNIQNPTDNVTGQTYPDFYQWALGDKYSGVCECLCGSGGDHNLYGDSRHSLEADGGSVRRLNE